MTVKDHIPLAVSHTGVDKMMIHVDSESAPVILAGTYLH